MRILIAEDDAHLRAGLSALLEAEGFQCRATADGEQALAAYRREKADFCIFDVMMPRMDGFELCRTLRADGEDVPIILLTAKGEEIDRVLGLELGADDYVPKPFGPRELVARIRAIKRRISEKEKAEDPLKGPFKIGDLTVDPTALRAYRDDERFELTRREVQILAVLKARRGQAVSRDELFDQCWGQDYVPNSRALDQYVFSLRHKVEIEPANPQIIETVHGVGYRYDGD